MYTLYYIGIYCTITANLKSCLTFILGCITIFNDIISSTLPILYFVAVIIVIYIYTYNDVTNIACISAPNNMYDSWIDNIC